MSTDIYYFSGTGNSLTAAKNIAQKIDGNLIPIASLTNKEVIETNAEAIGIVFPVYYGELPVIVKSFAKKLTGLEKKYVFAVCTYGGAAMGSLKSLKKVIRSKGGELSLAFGVHMPQNSFRKPKENITDLYSAWEKRLDITADKIKRRAKGTFFSDPALEWIMAPIQPLFIRPMCRKGFAKLTGMPKDSNMEELVHRLDTGFFTDEKCSGCGTCAKVCPVNNIVIEDQRPVWLHRCENCLACYNWCPNRAIQGGITQKGYVYRHADVELYDIMKQKHFAAHMD